MIISKQKPLDQMLGVLNSGSVFLVGCSECATLCRTGGEQEVLALKKILEKNGCMVTGWIILDPACHLLNNKRMLKPHQHAIEQADHILVLACGNGVQTVAELIEDKHVVPGTDTLFLGEIKRATQFEKRCSLCGDCLLESFDAICPVTRCPKHILNGPCGGSCKGKCEIDDALDCIWDVLVKRLEQKNKIHLLHTIQPPKNWSKSLEMRRVLGHHDSCE